MAMYTKKDLEKEIKRTLESEYGTLMFQKDINLVVDIFLELIQQHVAEGDTINLYGIGRFIALPMEGFTGRDPHNDKPAEVKPFNRICFKAGREFKRRVNGHEE